MSEGIIQRLQNNKKFSADEFAEIWCNYDSDGNGFIEGRELEKFLKEFLQKYFDQIPEDEYESLKKEFLNAIDENCDNKIEIAELGRILPEDEQFLLLFRRIMNIKTSQEFMKIWKNYDKNKDGFLEANEISEFLRHLISTDDTIVVEKEKLDQYAQTIVKLYDRNGDGKLQLSELSKLLPRDENLMKMRLLKNSEIMREEDLDKIFDHYDVNKNGTIEDEEFEGFLRDLMDLLSQPYTIDELRQFKDDSLKSWDLNHDGKISKAELKMMLLQTNKL